MPTFQLIPGLSLEYAEHADDLPALLTSLKEAGILAIEYPVWSSYASNQRAQSTEMFRGLARYVRVTHTDIENEQTKQSVLALLRGAAPTPVVELAASRKDMETFHDAELANWATVFLQDLKKALPSSVVWELPLSQRLGEGALSDWITRIKAHITRAQFAMTLKTFHPDVIALAPRQIAVVAPNLRYLRIPIGHHENPVVQEGLAAIFSKWRNSHLPGTALTVIGVSQIEGAEFERVLRNWLTVLREAWRSYSKS